MPFPLKKHQPCFVIAEVAQSHEGSLGMAHRFIDAAAESGADAIKFQTHIAAAESSPQEPWRVAFSTQDASRYDYWKRMEFTAEQWQELKTHTDDKGLIFLSSPFSTEAVELLDKIGTPAWKVASGELTNPLLLEAMQATGKPLLLSTGMSGWDEIDHVVKSLGDTSFALFQCTTAYPCPPEKLGLNILPQFRARYDCPIGLSDHSGDIYAGLAAVAAHQVELLEVHLCLNRQMFGPDVPVSLTPEQLKQLTDGIRFIETAQANNVDKDTESAKLEPLRHTFMKSLVLREALPKGTKLERAHLTAKKPCLGIPASQLHDVLGKTLTHDLPAGHFLVDGDIA